MSRSLIHFLAGSLIILWTSSLYSGPPSLLEFKTSAKTFRGKVVAKNRNFCWLMDRDGRLSRVKLDDVRDYRSLDSKFKRYSFAELRDQLRREFGREFDVAATEHYLVCAKRGEADRFAKVFEDIYRSFHLYLSRRNFRISRPEFPMVAIVFPNFKSFASYSAKDGVQATPGLKGYYLKTSNRVALFNPAAREVSQSEHKLLPHNRSQHFAGVFGTPPQNLPLVMSNQSPTSVVARIAHTGSLTQDIQGTIVHETTHQVAFNAGLHSRVGQNPLWITEGLATVFEAPGIRDSHASSPRLSRVNRERYLWFHDFLQKRRKPNTLAQFISSDALFRASVLDAYSQAWALSFYLIETRPGKYARYLKTVAARDPTKPYSAEQRLSDFKKSFGDDVDWLEVDFLRFMQRIER